MVNIKHAVVALALIAAPAAFAQTYIVPASDCGAVTLQVTRGADFPKLGEVIPASRVDGAYVFLPKEKNPVTVANGPGSLVFHANVPDSGVVIAGLDLKPEVSGNETRTEHAKTLIFCGAATPAYDWVRMIGLGLEIYPQGWNGPRPRMKTGDAMRFIAVDKATNKPIADLPMQLYGAAGRIAEGVPAQYSGMNFPYQPPGRYMVVATYRRADPDRPDHWLVDTSTLTFDIK